jgi:hypothetical protein
VDGLSRSDDSIGFIKVVFDVVEDIIDQGEDIIDQGEEGRRRIVPRRGRDSAQRRPVYGH